MSESNGSHRFEALESNAIEIQGQMRELMSMMRQLTQTRTARFGQQEEESGGTGRGAAHNHSGGAGRMPPTADRGHSAAALGATAVAGSPPTAGRRQNQAGLLNQPETSASSWSEPEDAKDKRFF